jgi:hypothetical protein
MVMVTGSVQVLRLVRVIAPRACVAAVGVVTPTAWAEMAVKPPIARAAATTSAVRLKILFLDIFFPFKEGRVEEVHLCSSKLAPLPNGDLPKRAFWSYCHKTGSEVLESRNLIVKVGFLDWFYDESGRLWTKFLPIRQAF